MAQPSQIPQQLMTAALLHFEQGVPIDDCNCLPVLRDRLARVSHVYWIWKKNPLLETRQFFYQLTKPVCSDRHSAWHAAEKDQALFDFVVQNILSTNRKVQEERVRFAANRLMKIGMDTDNAFALADGAKIAMKLDRLDMPEEERADMSKVAFLPSVVVTDIRQVDDTKENIDDEETKRIIAKYNAYVDEKHQMIDDTVEMIEARSGAKTLHDDYLESNENSEDNE